VAVEDKNGRTVLHEAADSWQENEAMAQLLVAEGADVMAKDKDEVTALDLAVENGVDKITRLLVKSGANTTVTNKNGVTVLHRAAGQWRENGEILQLLIEKGANVTAKGKDGMTALHLAAWRSHLGMISRFLELKADASATEEEWLAADLR
jgi:ankyrin repeat protein